MSKVPEVKIPITCDRTNKDTEIKMSLNSVVPFLEAAKGRQEAAAHIRTTFSADQAAGNALPDMVIFYKGALVVLPTVLAKHDSAVLRLLHEATQSDTFPKPPTKKRTSKTPPQAEAGATGKGDAPNDKSDSAKKNKSNGKSASGNVQAPAE